MSGPVGGKAILVDGGWIRAHGWIVSLSDDVVLLRRNVGGRRGPIVTGDST
jgi:hypothetical protein